MAVERKAVRTIIVLYAKGEFWGGDETDQLKQAVENEIGAGNQRLVFNLRQCTRMNSTAIGVVAGAKRDYDARNGRVVLCEINKSLQDVLTTTGLILRGGLPYYATEAQALASFAEEAG